jgi:hypothetical protein
MMMSQSDLQLTINPDDQRVFGPCACCGNMTQRVWGYVSQDETTIAAYFVEWTPGHSEQAANFDLIVGKWGTESTSHDRKGIALAFRQLQNGPSFMVINAVDRPIATSSLISDALSRDQVVGMPIAETVFAVCDAIFLRDHRIGPLRDRA